MIDAQSQLAIWRADPIAFIRDFCRDPESGQPFQLYPAQEGFLREALTVGPDGRLPYGELIYSCPKKSGKTMTAAWVALYVSIVLGGAYSEVIVCANDFEQATSRVYQAISRLLDPRRSRQSKLAKISANKIELPSTGGTIIAISSDAASAAGANPNLVVFDELWGYSSERSRRLFDELVPPPTRKIATRLTVTYAGYSDESELLEELYKRGIQGEEVAPALYRQPGMLMFWSHEPVAPWQTPAWLEQMRSQLRPNAYLRLIENRWVTSESSFIDMAWWDACTDPDLTPALGDPRVPIWVGVDASVKRDSTAIVCCTFDHATRKVKLIWHRTFQPTPQDPLDFSATVERTLLELRQRFRIREVKYDPFQLVAVAQRLTAAGLPMVEFPQSVPNLTSASSNLYELLKGRNLTVYPDDDLRLAMSRAVALETSRGWRIAKEKASHKIDSIVALAQAALGAVEQGQQGVGVDVAFQQRAAEFFRNAEMIRTGQQPRTGSIAEQDRAEDFANDMRRSSNPLRLVKSRRWGRGGY